MNKIKLTLALAAVAALAACCSVRAQTNLTQVPNLIPSTGNPVSDAFNLIGQDLANATNWFVAVGGGHSISGTGRGLAFAEGAFNFNQYIGLAFGYDCLSGNGAHEFNSVRGGITLQLPMHPFAFLGSTSLTNVQCTPLVFDQIATSSSGTAANLAGFGVDADVYDFKNFAIHAGALYETRSGDSRWDGNYLAFYAAFSRKF